jgi:hypothetical protein
LSSASDAYIQVNRGSITSLFGTDNIGTYVGQQGAYDLRLVTNAVERARIDSSGRLLIGTSSAPTVGVPASATFVVQGYPGVPTGDSLISLQRGQAPASISSGAQLGAITFGANDGSPYAQIHAATDGAGGTNDYPGRLVFSTTTDGATAPTERMRITSAGNVGIGTTSPGNPLDVSGLIRANDSSSDGNAGLIIATDSAARGYIGTAYYLNGGSETDIGYRVESGNNHIWMTGAIERARIDSSGRLLVGTSTSPTGGDAQYSKLVVKGYVGGDTGYAPIALMAGTNGASLANGNGIGRIEFCAADSASFAQITALVDGTTGSNDYPGRLVFSTTADGASSPTERMRIASDGRISTGTTGAPSTSSFGFSINRTGSQGLLESFRDVGSGDQAAIIGGNAGEAYIQGDGSLKNTNNSYGSISDCKLKENIVDANTQWSDIKALQVRNYNFKPETGYSTHTQIGLVAQEAELISPGLVSESTDRDEDGNDLGTVTKSVNYSVLYMKAVKALQEAMERIETLEAKVAALETP